MNGIDDTKIFKSSFLIPKIVLVGLIVNNLT